MRTFAHALMSINAVKGVMEIGEGFSTVIGAARHGQNRDEILSGFQATTLAASSVASVAERHIVAHMALKPAPPALP